MPGPGEILTVGKVRELLAQMKEAANEVEARLEGRPDDELLPPLPFELPGDWPIPPIPPRSPRCWPNPA